MPKHALFCGVMDGIQCFERTLPSEWYEAGLQLQLYTLIACEAKA